MSLITELVCVQCGTKYKEGEASNLSEVWAG